MFLHNSLSLVLGILAAVVSVPIGIFILECFAAILLRKSAKQSTKKNVATAILIPAHNEEQHIHLVVREAKKQLGVDDRLIVVADNCSDNTAELARGAGAEVLERTNAVERGKGYALDAGLQYLEKTGAPEVVVFLDADCVMSEETLTNLTSLAWTTGRPVQAKYLMEQESKPGLKDRVSTFALKVKNHVRFLGLSRLGVHCLLTGSGMAFPWSVINQVSLVGSINADDMKLTVDLTLKDLVPLYCENSLVVGRLMENEAAQSQRTRWEHGHLQMISVEVPKLVRAWLRQPRFSYLLLALDISIPPLSLLVTIWLAATVISLALTLVLNLAWLPVVVLTIAGVALTTTVFATWKRFGTQDLPFKDLIAIPFYILSKLPIYSKFLVNPQAGWATTERD